MDMGKFTGLCYPLKRLLRRVLKLIFMNLGHHKFTENMYEHIMQINNEELSILSDSSPLPDQFAEWNVSYCVKLSSFVKQSND